MKSHLKVDLIQNISLQISTLKFFHVWFFIPYSIKSFKFFLAVFIRVVLGVFVFIVPTLTQFIYVVKLMRADSPQIQEIASVINLVLTEALTSLKLADLRSRRHVLTQLTDQLISEEFYCFDEAHKRILEKGIKFSRRGYIGLLFIAAMDVFFHVVVSPAFHRFETLPLKMDLIYFDVSDPAYFDYFCAYQILYKPCMVAVYVVLQTMTWSFMFCANSQLDVLINKLENMKELVKITKAERGYDENEAFEEIFKSLVLHHAAILRFTKTFQAAFGGQLSMSLFVSSCIIGTTAVQIFSIESPRKNITEVIWVLAYLSIFIASLFVECYLGNAITYKCALIPTLVFAGPWLDLSLKMKRNLVMFIAKTQQPVVLVAAKLTPVSIETFTKIMNWTYKGFAVLNQMKN